MDKRPIGMFDSGIGGLTVLHECLVAHPAEDFVYLGDTGRFPYGPRSQGELRALSYQVASRLMENDIKLLVVACNSATSAALPWLQEHLEASIIGAVNPGATAAVQTTLTRKIGVLATEATIASGSYERALLNLDAGLEISQQACPRLADMIQHGEVFSNEEVETVRQYVAPLKQAGVDTAILGSTHYPLASQLLQRLLGREVTLVNSAREIAREVGAVLERKGIENKPGSEGNYTFLCTGDIDTFVTAGARFLQMPLGEVKQVDVAELERVDIAWIQG